MSICNEEISFWQREPQIGLKEDPMSIQAGLQGRHNSNYMSNMIYNLMK